MFYLVTYQTNNGLIHRILKHEPFYKIGSSTSMGWILLDVQIYSYNQNRFVSSKTSFLENQKNFEYMKSKKAKREMIEKIIDIILR